MEAHTVSRGVFRLARMRPASWHRGARTVTALGLAAALVAAAVMVHAAPTEAAVIGPNPIGTWSLSGIAGVELDPLTGYFHLVRYDTGVIDVAAASGTIVASYGAGELNSPIFASVTPTRVYVTDLNDTVDYFDRSTGVRLGGWGSAGSGNGEFADPWGIDAEGASVFVADSGNGRVQVFSLDGAWQRTITGAGSGHQLLKPRGITHFGGELYVVDSTLDEVVVFDPASGAYLRHWSLGVANDARGIDVTAAGQVYVSDLGTTSVYAFSTSGTLNGSFAAGNGPEDIAVDPLGQSIWASDFAASQWHSYSYATCNGVIPTLVGTSYRDVIAATAGSDVVFLDAGNDTASLLGGSDLACGGTGDDVIYGDEGNDTIIGGTGADELWGLDGNDILIGGSEADTIRGGLGSDDIQGQTGNDLLYGDGGSDLISGGGGADQIFGGAGIDIINGDADNDTIHGDGSADTITGGSGDDTVDGGAENDIIYGSIGNDSLSGGSGVDRIYGQEGNDVLRGDDGDDRVYGGAGNDTIFGGLGNDRLWGQGDLDQIFGEDGNDTIFGGVGNDSISGGPGADTVHAQGGDDTLDGDDGQDILYGHAGNDTIRGGFGNDSIFGHGGFDLLYGDGGDDLMYGGADNDLMIGGFEDDVLLGQAGDDALFGDDGLNDFCNGGAGTDTAATCETVLGVP